MKAWLRSWWQKIKRHPIMTAIIIVAGVLVVALIVLGYWFNWPWVGVNGGYSKITTTSTTHGITTAAEQPLMKTLWDWLQLLIVPLALAVVALVFQLANTRTERQIAKQHYEQDQQISLDKQHEDLLQAYLDRMSELLLKEKLRSSEVDAEARNVARVRTTTVLCQLDARRVSYIFAFLREAGLMLTQTNGSVVSLSKAELHGVNWSQAELNGANLSGANLDGANLSEAYLYKANLYKANLRLANLRLAKLAEANLSETILRGINLSGAWLRKANLSGADLSWASPTEANVYANLSGADLSGADLSGADLSGADLSKANLSGADLSKANLSGADLSKAKVTEEQLKEVKSLQGAILPDGSKHL
jgi:uncharacterized protein YjbI with pentapeptide repeats